MSPGRPAQRTRATASKGLVESSIGPKTSSQKRVSRIVQVRPRRRSQLMHLIQLSRVRVFVARGQRGSALSARIRLERSGVPDLSRAFAALDAGDNEQALDMLIESITLARSSRDEIRRVVVGVLDELGLD